MKYHRERIPWELAIHSRMEPREDWFQNGLVVDTDTVCSQGLALNQQRLEHVGCNHTPFIEEESREINLHAWQALRGVYRSRSSQVFCRFNISKDTEWNTTKRNVFYRLWRQSWMLASQKNRKKAQDTQAAPLRCIPCQYKLQIIQISSNFIFSCWSVSASGGCGFCFQHLVPVSFASMLQAVVYCLICWLFAEMMILFFQEMK